MDWTELAEAFTLNVETLKETRSKLERAELALVHIEEQLRPLGMRDPELAYMTVTRYLKNNGLMEEQGRIRLE